MHLRLFRVIHESLSKSPLAAYRAPGRYHLTAEEAASTSYLAFSPETCVKEVSHHLGGTVALQNRLVIEFDVHLSQIVDLTLARERKKHGIQVEDLTGDDDLSLPQGIARRLRKKGVQALVVPSARHLNGRNVVLFLENVDKKLIRKIREERLERV